MVLLNEVVEARPEQADAQFILGKYHLEQQALNTSLQHFEAYSELAPDDPQVFRALATLHLRLSHIDEAFTALERVIELEPNDANAYRSLGHLLFSDGQTQAALEQYRAALTRDSENIHIRYDIASVHFLKQDYQAAFDAFNQLIELKPDHLGALYFRAESLLKMGQYEAAETEFRALLKLKPDYFYLYLKLAQINLEQGGLEDAKRELEKAQLDQSTLPDILGLAGILYRRLGEPAKARDIHQRLVEAKPEETTGYQLLAQDLFELGETTQALEALRKATELDSLSQDSWRNYSIGLLHAGKAAAADGSEDLARNYFRDAIELEFHAAQAYLNLALLDLRRDDLSEAKRKIEAAQSAGADPSELGPIKARLHILKGGEQPSHR